jgi:hypothetical protein
MKLQIRDRILLPAIFLLAFIAPAVAQDADAEPMESEATGEPAKKEKSFPLFVEVLYGDAASDAILTPIVTSANISFNTFEMDSADNARTSIAWNLKRGMEPVVGKGRFRLLFDGYKETGYRFGARGQTFDVFDTSSATPSTQLGDSMHDWWILDIAGGILTSSSPRPSWDSTTDDANSDGVPNADEVTVLPAVIMGTTPVIADLETQIQTIELLYERSWGKRVLSASWGAGLRYFTYEGNYPVAAWIRPATAISVGEPFGGYTNGLSAPILTLYEQTEGVGPTGYVEMQYNVFGDRLQLYGTARAAFVLQSMDATSGEFATLVLGNSGEFISAPASLDQTLDKDVWHTGAEIGARLRLAGGLKLHLGYHLTAYQDSILIPQDLSVPETPAQIQFGTTATFNTRDFIISGWRAGFSFEF